VRWGYIGERVYEAALVVVAVVVVKGLRVAGRARAGGPTATW
jgi:hypothetical protein